MSGKPLPVHQSDEEAARFVDEADLSEYDLSKGRWVRLNFFDEEDQREVASIDVPRAEMELARRHAEREGLSLNTFLTRLVHDALERSAS